MRRMNGDRRQIAAIGSREGRGGRDRLDDRFNAYIGSGWESRGQEWFRRPACMGGMQVGHLHHRVKNVQVILDQFLTSSGRGRTLARPPPWPRVLGG